MKKHTFIDIQNKYLWERILEYHYCNITGVVGFYFMLPKGLVVWALVLPIFHNCLQTTLPACFQKADTCTSCHAIQTLNYANDNFL